MVYTIQAMADGGECVAIIPRSWMDGEYLKDSANVCSTNAAPCNPTDRSTD
ncbi:MAG: hypothetical protein SOH72_02935 [Bifidobacterium thermacidophilum]|uniref:hypothetical protein n=1 Tax=Bifidobacterium thermacidophilum TaxID=246618 RepID=UPI002F35CCDB